MSSERHTSKPSRYQTVGGESSKRTFRRNMYILLAAAFGIIFVQIFSKSCDSAPVDPHSDWFQEMQETLEGAPLIEHVDIERQPDVDNRPVVVIRAIYSAGTEPAIEFMLKYAARTLADVLPGYDPLARTGWRFYVADRQDGVAATYVGNANTLVMELIDIAKREPGM